MSTTDVIILAAGLGTRMKSSRVKVLHEAAGRAMIDYVLDRARELSTEPPIVVVGHQSDLVRQHCGNAVTFAFQQEQLGTGHAVLQTAPLLGDRGIDGRIAIVLSGDVPLVRPETLQELVDRHASSGATVTFLTMTLDDPAHYGRVVRDEKGSARGIVEAKDSSPEELAIREVNAGLYAFDERFLIDSLGRISTDNAQKEYYLTELVDLAAKQGLRIEAVGVEEPVEALGVNSRTDLATVERELRRRRIAELQASGVTFRDPDSTMIDATVEIGPDTIVYPFVCLERGTRIGRDCTIEPGAHLRATVVGDRVRVRTGSVTDEAEIGDDCAVGPYAHLRTGTRLGRSVKVGNFVETKKAVFGEGAKASHLSYIGDAEVGADVNIGAGTITCNYDGVQKHKTKIGDRVFIGSDTQLVAPVTIGAGAYVGAGSTITKDVPPDALALTRSPQKVVEGWATKRRARKRDDHDDGVL